MPCRSRRKFNFTTYTRMACCWFWFPAYDVCVSNFVITSMGRPRNSSALATLNSYFLLSSFVVAYQASLLCESLSGDGSSSSKKLIKERTKEKSRLERRRFPWLLSHQWQLALAKELFMVMSLRFFSAPVFTFWTWKDGKTNDFALRERWQQKPTFTKKDRFVKIRAPNCWKKFSAVWNLNRNERKQICSWKNLFVTVLLSCRTGNRTVFTAAIQSSSPQLFCVINVPVHRLEFTPTSLPSQYRWTVR